MAGISRTSDPGASTNSVATSPFPSTGLGFGASVGSFGLCSSSDTKVPVCHPAGLGTDIVLGRVGSDRRAGDETVPERRPNVSAEQRGSSQHADSVGIGQNLM